MFLRRLHLILMLFAALWLPIQAVAAQTMTLCRHGQGELALMGHEAPAADAMADCPMHHGAHQARPSADTQDHGLGCDQCGFCHLAAAGFMSGPEPGRELVPASRVFVAVVPVIAASNVPEPPQRPPRRMV